MTATGSSVGPPPPPPSGPRLHAEAWSDLGHEGSYVAKHRLEHAVQRFDHPHEVQVLHRSLTGGTHDADRMLHMALAQGGPQLQAAVLERLFSARFDEGRDLLDGPTLQRLGAEAGLDEVHLGALLAGDEHAADVRADQEAAQALSITAVPALVLNGRLVVTGTCAVAELVELLRQAWRELGS